MNRIHPLAQQVTEALSAQGTASGQGLLSSACREGVHHALFGPLHYEPNYAYPLVVWLHGPEDNERQLQRVMPLISMRNYVAVAPRGTRGLSDGSRFDWHQSLQGILAAEQRVFECIDLAQEKYNIARGRIFLAGFRSGGTMAFRVALRSPERFAGVLSIAGPFPTDHTPLIHLERVRRLPLFIAQGRTSRQYCVERACQELRLFHAAGLAVTVRQYPCGDELSTQMLHDLNVWIMEQVTGVETAPDTAYQRPRPGEAN